MTSEAHTAPDRKPSWPQELAACWRQIPGKGLFFGLLAAWVLLFQFFGNATLGYVNTPSLFGWLEWIYQNAEDDAHGRLIPFVVLALTWWKRDELVAVPKKQWWPAMGLLVLALVLHSLGCLVQQTQISVVAFFTGLYGLMGLTWGPRWLVATFFPFCLFAFCVPVQNISGSVTFYLRLLATHITTACCHVVLGINVIQNGTDLIDPLGRYKYEVAAACSGIRSLTAIVALAVICAFLMLKSPWRRLLVVTSAFPLAVAANVFRLTTIIIAAEAFGQAAGNNVHASTWLSLLPYVPAIAGLLLVSRWLRETKAPRRAGGPSPLSATEQNV